MRIAIATDAWEPQVNGVVRSLRETAKALAPQGVEVVFVTPEGFATLPMPSYPEIRLSLVAHGEIGRRLDRLRPDAVHIATEGPIGWAARAACRRRGWAFTTSYHTRFPEYLAARLPVPLSWSYAVLRRFHAAAARTLVSTETLRRELSGRGFERLGIWSRGVDTDLFRPRAEPAPELSRPVFLYVGRVAVEKNLEAFLRLDLPGSKVVVGDGPARAALRQRYPAARFLGVLTGEALARIYAASDVFVFPSLTDTYGVVLLEAAASGLPIAAFPVAGPIDVVGDTDVAVLDSDLRAACLDALAIPRERCRAFGLSRSWAAAAAEFLGNLVGVGGEPLAALPPPDHKAAAE